MPASTGSLATFGTPEQRRLVLSLLLGLLLTAIAVNVETIFHGAAITPLLDDIVNLPGVLFTRLFGSPLGSEHTGLWHALFYLGDLVAYTFIAYIALSVGNARSHQTRRR